MEEASMKLYNKEELEEYLNNKYLFLINIIEKC